MRKILVILIVGMMCFLYGCSSVNTEQKNMYNDDKLIQKEGDSFSFFSRTGDNNDSKLDIKYSRFYGAQTIWNIDVKEQGEIKFEIDSIVDKGKFKGVLISEDNIVTNIFEGDKKDSEIVVLTEGKYRFKIVGYDSSGKVVVQLKLDENMSSAVIED